MAFPLPRFLKAVLCFTAGAGSFWIASYLSDGALCPNGQYELRTNFLGKLPMLVDSRTGDTWVFLPVENKTGWQYYEPPRRPTSESLRRRRDSKGRKHREPNSGMSHPSTPKRKRRPGAPPLPPTKPITWRAEDIRREVADEIKALRRLEQEKSERYRRGHENIPPPSSPTTP